MRRAARVDATQAEIVKALRAIGAKVVHLHQLGSDVPDLLVGYRGRNALMEVKTVGKTLSKGQAEFFQSWPGEAWIVQSVPQALEAIIGKEHMK